MTRFMKYLFKMATIALLSFGVVYSASADKLKVGFIYIGPPGDHGWTYAHDQARLYIEDQLGDKVVTTFIEGVPEGPDAERTIAKLAENRT